MLLLIICLLVFSFHVDAAPKKIWEINEGMDLYEGDIILDPDERPVNGSLKFAAIIGKRWPNPVPYEFGPSMKHQPNGKRVIMEAIEQYHKYTCIRFVPRTTEKGFVQFVHQAGCASGVGYYPGKVNKIHLDAPCWHLGTVMHEMGHRLGLWHEQSRPDRDEYIKIVWDNIKERTDVDDMGTKYDLASMMHYGTTEFSNGDGRTIRSLDYSKRLLMGNRQGFSDKDVQILNLMYKCPVYKGTVPPKVCRDNDEKECAKQKHWGRCKNVMYETKMYQECCKTCFGNVSGKLGEPKTWPHYITEAPTTAMPTQPGECKDKASKSQCDYWARMGYCKSRTAAIRRMALDQCCATCKAQG